jgi:chromosome segregation ATPase
LKTLESAKEEKEDALARCKKSLASLEHYLEPVAAQHVKSSDLATTMENYDAAAAVLDGKASKLKKELLELDQQIKEERLKLGGPKENDLLKMKASVGVFAKEAGDVEINLIYGMFTTWRLFV